MSNMKRSSAAEPAAKRAPLPFLDPPPGAVPAGDRVGVRAKSTSGFQLGRFRPQEIRRHWLRYSALIMVGLPTLLAIVYYGLIAARQYAVEVRFAIRGGSHTSSSPSGSDILSSIGVGGAGGLATIGDAYIVIDYIKSREIVEKMRPLADIRTVYSHPQADMIASLNPNDTIENIVEYWRSMIDVSFDMISQIISVQVRAFTREDATRVAEGVLVSSEELINLLSERARLDAVKFAEQDVKRNEDRLRANRALMRTFRDTQQEIDPLKKADSQLSLQSSLETSLAAAKARLLTLRQ